MSALRDYANTAPLDLLKPRELQLDLRQIAGRMEATNAELVTALEGMLNPRGVMVGDRRRATDALARAKGEG